MMKNGFVKALLPALILSSCLSVTLPKTNQEPDFELIILRENWLDLEMGYEGPLAQSTLQAANTRDPLFVIDQDRIADYDWDLQTITLTQTATDELGEVLTKMGAAEPDEIQKLQGLKESLGWGNPIERALYIHPFLVRVDDQFKYGGIFLDAPSQMGIQFPVARIMIGNGKAVIALLPTHIPFVMIDPIDGNGNVRNFPIADEAINDLQQSEAFSDWSLQFATSATAITFRGMIRDENIRLAVKTAGK